MTLLCLGRISPAQTVAGVPQRREWVLWVVRHLAPPIRLEREETRR